VTTIVGPGIACADDVRARRIQSRADFKSIKPRRAVSFSAHTLLFCHSCKKATARETGGFMHLSKTNRGIGGDGSRKPWKIT